MIRRTVSLEVKKRRVLGMWKKAQLSRIHAVEMAYLSGAYGLSIRIRMDETYENVSLFS